MSPARAGTQTHISFKDLLRLTPCRGWETMATIVIKATVNRAKRLMGFMDDPLMSDTEAVSSQFLKTPKPESFVGASTNLCLWARNFRFAVNRSEQTWEVLQTSYLMKFQLVSC